jgi:uncharacterized protein YneF (UPF0154 family)
MNAVATPAMPLISSLKDTRMEDLPEQEVQPELEALDADGNDSQPSPRSPAFVLNFYSWWIPIVGVVMLLVGLVGGYFLRPLLPGTQTAEQPTDNPSEVSSLQTQAPQPTMDPETRKQLMDYLLPNVKHFKGDANAPVTLLEFSDFQ